MPDVYLGKYEALEPLGRGSMGEVLLAQPIGRPEQRVVIKVMNERATKEPRFRQFFEREIEYTARLRHPYVVHLLDASFDDPHGPCLVMEYIPGITLAELLKTEGRLAPERVGRLLGCLCHALEAAHHVGVVHRDLKPANLMITDAGTPQESLRVMDFGLAQLTLKPHFSAERLAGASQIAASGTPSYVCPEQLRGDEVDARADIYSVGVILYEMLTGHGPFPDHFDAQMLLRAHVHSAPRQFAEVGVTKLEPAVEQIVMHCLAKYPVERPQTGKELAERFGKALHEDIWTPTRPADEPAQAPIKRKPLSKAGLQPLPDDPHTLMREFEAWMPERIAVIKLRGFLGDFGGRLLVSDPGVLRMQIGESTKGGLLSLLGLKSRRPDAVEIEFQMEKPHPNENRLVVTVFFRAAGGHEPRDPTEWRRSCERIFNELRSYLIAEV